MNYRFVTIIRWILLVGMLFGFIAQPQYSVSALNFNRYTSTWNVIGLDSNNVNVGPNRFPVGARVCNTGIKHGSHG